jgi:hypothetical protein
VAALASPITTNSRSDWLAQVNSPTNIDFESQSVGVNYTSSGYMINSIQFVGYTFPEGNFYTEIGNGSDWGFTSDTSHVLRGDGTQAGGQPYIMVTVPNLTAFGVDIMSYVWNSGYQYGGDVAVTVYDNVLNFTYQVTALGNTIPPAFLGVINPDPIYQIKIQAANGVTLIDNFSWGTPINPPSGGDPPPGDGGGDVPEVTTLIMLASGLFLLRMGKKRFTGLAA